MKTEGDATVLIDGVPQAGTGLSVFDRGLQFGDGLFETIACAGGRPRLLPLHLERLESGCERLRIAPPDLEATAAEIERLAAGAGRALIKLIVTAGVSTRGYARPAGGKATRITIRYPWPDEDPARSQDGVRVRTLTLRLGENPHLAGLKHCNRLEQVLARAELAGEADLDEGILFSSSGSLVSGIMSNLFLVRESCLLTPRIDQCGVSGVMRRVVLREARQAAIPVRECELRAPDLHSAQEVFLTNARIGIWPVRALDHRVLTPGPVTRHLSSILTNILDNPPHA